VEGTDKTHTWIIDPLDGTTNFLHAIPHFAINIALERQEANGPSIVAAVTYNPIVEEMFWAERGRGAF
jgi:myo-inositol-1(or 4)-monophosphatase